MEAELIYLRKKPIFPESVDTDSGSIKQFLQFIGENEDMQHYSGVLLQT